MSAPPFRHLSKLSQRAMNAAARDNDLHFDGSDSITDISDAVSTYLWDNYDDTYVESGIRFYGDIDALAEAVTEVLS